METRANFALVGLFTLAVVAAAFGFVYWFSSNGSSAERAVYRIKFENSVSGLRTGASVLFNGVRVGEVTSVDLDKEDPHQVFVVMAIDHSASVREDTVVGLSFQGLTGVSSVALTGGSSSSPTIAGAGSATVKAGGSRVVLPLLTANPAASQDLIQAAREMLQHGDAILVDNAETLKSAIANLNIFTEAMASNTGRIDDILAGVENMVGGKGGGGELQKATRAIAGVAENLDKRIGEVAAGVNRLTASSNREIKALSADGKRTLDTVDRAVKNLDANPSRLLFGGSGSTVRESEGRR